MHHEPARPGDTGAPHEAPAHEDHHGNGSLWLSDTDLSHGSLVDVPFALTH